MNTRQRILVIFLFVFTLAVTILAGARGPAGGEGTRTAEFPSFGGQMKIDAEREKTQDATKTMPEKGNTVPAVQPSDQQEQPISAPEDPPADLFYSYPDELKVIPDVYYDLALSFPYFG